MITEIRERITVMPGGRIEIPTSPFDEGIEVDVVVRRNLPGEEMDETEYLLSTEANRLRMYEMLEELKHPENFIPLDLDKYEEGRHNS